jgi:ATP-dependent Clp protease protease subunit
MEDTDDEKTQYLKVQGNSIYFYCDVSVESILEFNSELRKLDMTLNATYMDPTIYVYIHSPGGDLHAGFSAHDHIRMCKSKVVTVADGLTASAAAIMYLGGHKRLVTRNAWIMIHQMSNEVWGNFDEMKAELENCQKLMKHMTSLCRRLTDLSEHKLEELMHKDILLSSKKCLKYGVAHEICAA